MWIKLISGSLTVLNGHDLERLSSLLSKDQTLCEDEELPLTILYEFGGGATSARVTGLPPELTGLLTEIKLLFLAHQLWMFPQLQVMNLHIQLKQ